MARGLKPQTITSDSVTGSAEIERSLKFNGGDGAYLVERLVVLVIERNGLLVLGLKDQN